MSALIDYHKLSLSDRDVAFMREALKEAVKAAQEDEVPVGAVLVVNQKIVSRGHNQVELLQDATAHAEMICLTAGAAALGNWRLSEAMLYCTLEPCCMCAGAMLSSRLKRLVWAAPDLRLGANGSWIDVFASKHPMTEIEIANGVLKDEAADLMRAFFQKQRKKPGS
ncbi:MAG: yfhC [Parachlamydiales bacterium]|nr:yfhC [Parachlamydiales bacterium]